MNTVMPLRERCTSRPGAIFAPLLSLVLCATAGEYFVCAASDGHLVDVKSFGAVGDGSTDDTKAIQAAIDSVGGDGGTVLFPPGTYRLSMVGIKPGIRYLGYGAKLERLPNQGKWTRTLNAALPG